MLGEYHGLADDYPWPLPEGVDFPATLPPPQEPTMYEVGEGKNQADSFWICSWMGEWIRADTSGELAAAESAGARVERADETQPHREHYDDPRDVWHLEILAPARAGHPEAFHEFYSTSCGFEGLATL